MRPTSSKMHYWHPHETHRSFSVTSRQKLKYPPFLSINAITNLHRSDFFLHFNSANILFFSNPYVIFLAFRNNAIISCSSDSKRNLSGFIIPDVSVTAIICIGMFTGHSSPILYAVPIPFHLHIEHTFVIIIATFLFVVKRELLPPQLLYM